MIISIEHPATFYLLIPLLLAVTYVSVKFIRTHRLLSEKKFVIKSGALGGRLVICFFFKTFFRVLSGMMVIAALAGISWGTDSIPVQKNGHAVSMVFDISYSMEAKDAPGGISRLKASASYAKELLEHMEGTKVSVVLAKGDGVVAIPLTEDLQSVNSLIDCLSPKLMTQKGSSLGNGIKAAISSFPEQSAEASCILLFTDCEETDNTLQSALAESSKFGMPVIVIGFGSERESEIFSGDGSVVKTALRSSDMEKVIASLSSKNSRSQVQYIDASELGSASRILKAISSETEGTVITYENQSVKKYPLFITLAIVFYLASIVFGELDIKGGKKRILHSVAQTSMVLLMFTSCSPRFNDGTKILQGKLEWNKEKYQQATAYYLEAAENSALRGDESTRQYAVYNLGTTYLQQGETDAAVMRFMEIYENSPDKIRFAILYNCGIIAHRNGDYENAADYFRRALTIDGTNINAKINLELSLREESSKAQQAERELTALSENPEEQALEAALYSLIKEGETKQWKSMEQESEKSARDY